MFNFFNKFDTEDLFEFFYVWEMYVDFGRQSIDAVSECAKSAQKPFVKSIMEGMLKEIRNGASTDDAMAKFPEFFPPYTVEMVRIGERSGQMHKILSNLVFSLEHEMEMEKDIKQAMWMPQVFVFLLSICFCILVFYVIPRMGDVLREMDLELPLVTRFVLGLGTFMVDYWFLVIIAIIALIAGWKVLMQRRPDLRDQVRFRMPFLGPIRLSQCHFRIASVIGMCLEANVHIRAAVRYAAEASDSYYVRSTLLSAVRKMDASGVSFLDALQSSNTQGIIPDSFFLLIHAGSQGNLGEVLLKLANRKQKDILRLSKQVGDKLAFSVIMPAALVLVFLVLSIELPTWEVLNNPDATGLGGGLQ